MSLEQSRMELNYLLDNLWKPDWVKANWPGVSAVINNWWIAYKQWEAADTFREAFLDDRMTVRTFDADFNKQVRKQFTPGSFEMTDQKRFFKDSKYTPLPANEQLQHQAAFYNPDEYIKYHADRGIDSSAFMNPDNFANSETKYGMGLHDLSASLLNHEASIFRQVHHKGQGAHYAFVPLSMEKDQEVLFRLIQLAKAYKATIPQLYERVRLFRASMTRVKLAQDSDMAIGYIAVPVQNAEPGIDKPPAYKVRYSLGSRTTPTGGAMTDTTPEIYEARRKAARKFKEILKTEYAKTKLHSLAGGSKNEIVVALRHHAGDFPIFAARKGNILECYYVAHGLQVPSGKKISENGIMT